MIQLEVAAGPVPELTADRLWQAGAAGIEERGDRLIAGFTDAAVAEALALELGGTTSAGDHHAALEAERHRMQPRTVGPFHIRAPWHPSLGDRDIIIDPGHAFGSASHQTTRLACELIGALDLHGCHVVDLGCGTGVLSFAAAHQGADPVLGIDIDPIAVEAADTNLGHNPDLTAEIQFRCGSDDHLPAAADLLIVNVTIDIHEVLAPAVLRSIQVRQILVTGVLAGDQEQRVAELYRGEAVRRAAADDWVALMLHGSEPEPIVP